MAAFVDDRIIKGAMIKLTLIKHPVSAEGNLCRSNIFEHLVKATEFSTAFAKNYVWNPFCFFFTLLTSTNLTTVTRSGWESTSFQTTLNVVRVLVQFSPR